MRAIAAVLFSFFAAASGRALTPDTVAVQGAPAQTSGAVVGVEARTASPACSKPTPAAIRFSR